MADAVFDDPMFRTADQAAGQLEVPAGQITRHTRVVAHDYELGGVVIQPGFIASASKVDGRMAR